MEIKTGFYQLNNVLDSNNHLREFFKDAINLAYNVHIDVLDCNKSWSRERCTTKTIEEMIKNVNTAYHNVCIDRSIQGVGEMSNYGEIGYCTLGSPDYFLYIYLTLENLKILVKKYKLEMK